MHNFTPSHPHTDDDDGGVVVGSGGGGNGGCSVQKIQKIQIIAIFFLQDNQAIVGNMTVPFILTTLI